MKQCLSSPATRPNGERPKEKTSFRQTGGLKGASCRGTFDWLPHRLSGLDNAAPRDAQAMASSTDRPEVPLGLRSCFPWMVIYPSFVHDSSPFLGRAARGAGFTSPDIPESLARLVPVRPQAKPTTLDTSCDRRHNPYHST